MKVVWKFELEYGSQQVMMPAGAEVLAIGFQLQPVVWALVDPDAARMPRGFHVVATGEPMAAEPGRHVGTVTDVHGFVTHVFEWASAGP